MWGGGGGGGGLDPPSPPRLENLTEFSCKKCDSKTFVESLAAISSQPRTHAIRSLELCSHRRTFCAVTAFPSDITKAMVIIGHRLKRMVIQTTSLVTWIWFTVINGCKKKKKQKNGNTKINLLQSKCNVEKVYCKHNFIYPAAC